MSSVPIKIHKTLKKAMTIKGLFFNLTVTYSNHERSPYAIDIKGHNNEYNTSEYTSKLEEVPGLLLKAKQSIEKQIDEVDYNSNKLKKLF